MIDMTVEAKWVVAGDSIVAGIDYDDQSEIKNGLVVVFKTKEDMAKAMRGEMNVFISGADFDGTFQCAPTK